MLVTDNWLGLLVTSDVDDLFEMWRAFHFLELKIFLQNFADKIVKEKKSNVKMTNAGNMPDGQVATFSSYVG